MPTAETLSRSTAAALDAARPPLTGGEALSLLDLARSKAEAAGTPVEPREITDPPTRVRSLIEGS